MSAFHFAAHRTEARNNSCIKQIDEKQKQTSADNSRFGKKGPSELFPNWLCKPQNPLWTNPPFSLTRLLSYHSTLAKRPASSSSTSCRKLQKRKLMGTVPRCQRAQDKKFDRPSIPKREYRTIGTIGTIGIIGIINNRKKGSLILI